METIRKMPFAAAFLNLFSSVASKVKSWFHSLFRSEFIPKEGAGGGGKKGAGKTEETQTNSGAETDPCNDPIPEWKRIDDPGTGMDTPFARTGGGHEDVRPPDFDRYVVLGLGSGDGPAGVCMALKISLEIESDCPRMQDKLVIDRVPSFDAAMIGTVELSNKPGEHTYYTVRSAETDLKYTTYIPEIEGGGAIRVLHKEPKTIAELGVQFLLRIS